MYREKAQKAEETKERGGKRRKEDLEWVIAAGNGKIGAHILRPTLRGLGGAYRGERRAVKGSRSGRRESGAERENLSGGSWPSAAGREEVCWACLRC